MIRTLIVEDAAEKRQRISQALGDVAGFDIENITHVSDVFAAKRALSYTSYDLLILDIDLPMRADQAPQSDAGLILLEELIARPTAYRLPAHIIGMTAYPEIHSRTSGKFSSRLLTLVYYDPTSSEWEHSLQARARHIIDSEASRATVTKDYETQLGIVCGLDTPELTSVLRLPWNWSQVSLPSDHTIYWRGSYLHNGERRIVHAAAGAHMGIPAAAILSAKMIYEFRPRYMAMTGITAGIRGRVHLGDIIAADPCWDWGCGKWTLEEGQPRFLAAPRQIPLSVHVRDRIRAVANDTTLLARIRDEWQGDRPPNDLHMRIGPLASGASVLADRLTAERVLQQHRQLLGIEMEVYGIYAAAEEACDPRPTAFAIKSVVDFADGDKDDRYRGYAAFTSAEMLRHLAENYL